MRVQLYGQRLSCNISQFGALRQRLQQERRSRKHMDSHNMGACREHREEEVWGNCSWWRPEDRDGEMVKDRSESFTLEHSVVGEQQVASMLRQVEDTNAASVIGEVPPAVGEGRDSVVG